MSGKKKGLHNRVDIESFNGSSMCLNGTSLEDIKEMTLNMKVPTSLNHKTKTDAETKMNFEVGHSSSGMRVTEEEDHEI